jgi:hypothetical protein
VVAGEAKGVGMNTASTIPGKTEDDSAILKKEPPKFTPCGYKAGGLRASDGTKYQVLPSGQIVRLEPKRSKAELKRRKKEQRVERLHNGKGA